MEKEISKTGSLWEDPHTDYAIRMEHIDRFYEPELHQIVHDLELDMSGFILDAGCGAGFISRMIAMHVHKEATVIGIDLSLPHLIRANMDAQYPFWIQADIHHLPFNDNFFDLVWCAKTIWSLPDPFYGLQEMRRVIKTGGRIVLMEAGLGLGLLIPWDTTLELHLRCAQQQLRENWFAKQPQISSTTRERRNLVGLCRKSGLNAIKVRSYVVERIYPLSTDDKIVLQEIITNSFGHDIQVFISESDRNKWLNLWDPHSPNYLLENDGFHCIIVLTVLTAYT